MLHRRDGVSQVICSVSLSPNLTCHVEVPFGNLLAGLDTTLIHTQMETWCRETAAATHVLHFTLLCLHGLVHCSLLSWSETNSIDVLLECTRRISANLAFDCQTVLLSKTTPLYLVIRVMPVFLSEELLITAHLYNCQQLTLRLVCLFFAQFNSQHVFSFIPKSNIALLLFSVLNQRPSLKTNITLMEWSVCDNVPRMGI